MNSDEYGQALWCYGCDAPAARVAFQHLDRGGDGYLTVREIEQAVEAFYLSDNLEAPGNWLIWPD